MIHPFFKKVLSVCLLAGFLLPVIALAAETVFVSDIMTNPTRYMNMTVRLSGRVQDSTPAGPTLPGSYVLVDDTFEGITVITYTPPAPGSEITIEGMVSVDPQTQVPYIRELSVVKGSPLPIYAIIAGVVVLILIAVLIIILKKPAEGPRAKTAVTGTAVTRAKTEKISDTEARLLSRAKTEKIPSKPAQLEILSGDKKGEQILLVEESTIGRDKGNVRFPNDRGVSGEHARIKYVEEKYYLMNVSLTNPTKINGKILEEEHELADGDEILFGTVKAKFSFMQ